MERKIGLSSARARANASSPHGYQSTGLCACWSRYGDFSAASRFVCAMFGGELATEAEAVHAKGKRRRRRRRTAGGGGGGRRGGGRARPERGRGEAHATDGPARVRASARPQLRDFATSCLRTFVPSYLRNFVACREFGTSHLRDFATSHLRSSVACRGLHPSPPHPAPRFLTERRRYVSQAGGRRQGRARFARRCATHNRAALACDLAGGAVRQGRTA